MLDIFGYSSKEKFLNARPLAISPRKQPDGAHSILKIKEMKRLAIEKGNHQFEWVYKKENGTLFWTDIMLTYITLNGRETIYVVCRDISERKEIELELARQKMYFTIKQTMMNLQDLQTVYCLCLNLKKVYERQKNYIKNWFYCS